MNPKSDGPARKPPAGAPRRPTRGPARGPGTGPARGPARGPTRGPARGPARRSARARDDRDDRDERDDRGPRHLTDSADEGVDRRRRSLAQRGGAIEESGDPQASSLLAATLRAAEAEPLDELTHGFHSYPARMHPVIAAELVGGLSKPGDRVLDPFVGSGTVLLEAMVQGRRAIGVDLNPLALRIAELRCQLRDADSCRRFEQSLGLVAQASEERVRARAEVRVPIAHGERGFYDPHVMLELSGLWAEIANVPIVEDRRALELVFSSLLTKFSRQRGDTSEAPVAKRIRKGLVTEFFARKGHELSLRWQALFDAAPQDAVPARLVQGDARDLVRLSPKGFRAQLILTSPPYGGTYDYVAHHARRFAWLGLDDKPLREHEIGARRNLSQGPNAPADWDRELNAVLSAMSDVLDPEGRIVLWLGDAEVGKTRVAADAQITRLAAKTGLQLTAAAAQTRADLRGGAARREHLLLLRPR